MRTRHLVSLAIAAAAHFWTWAAAFIFLLLDGESEHDVIAKTFIVLPVVLTGVAFMFVRARSLRIVAWLLSFLMLATALVAISTIGWFLMPAAGLVFLAAMTMDLRQEPH